MPEITNRIQSLQSTNNTPPHVDVSGFSSVVRLCATVWNESTKLGTIDVFWRCDSHTDYEGTIKLKPDTEAHLGEMLNKNYSLRNLGLQRRVTDGMIDVLEFDPGQIEFLDPTGSPLPDVTAGSKPRIPPSLSSDHVCFARLKADVVKISVRRSGGGIRSRSHDNEPPGACPGNDN